LALLPHSATVLPKASVVNVLVLFV